MKALADVFSTQEATDAKVEAAHAKAEEEVTAARAEAKKVAEDEFGAGFFQGYTDLKRRVALDHPEWNLSAFLGVDSNY